MNELLLPLCTPSSLSRSSALSNHSEPDCCLHLCGSHSSRPSYLLLVFSLFNTCYLCASVPTSCPTCYLWISFAPIITPLTSPPGCNKTNSYRRTQLSSTSCILIPLVFLTFFHRNRCKSRGGVSDSGDNSRQVSSLQANPLSHCVFTLWHDT